LMILDNVDDIEIMFGSSGAEHRTIDKEMQAEPAFSRMI